MQLTTKEKFKARKIKELNRKTFPNDMELNIYVYHSFNTKQMNQSKREELMAYIESVDVITW